jgi:hypothetical protein
MAYDRNEQYYSALNKILDNNYKDLLKFKQQTRRYAQICKEQRIPTPEDTAEYISEFSGNAAFLNYYIAMFEITYSQVMSVLHMIPKPQDLPLNTSGYEAEIKLIRFQDKLEKVYLTQERILRDYLKEREQQDGILS